MTKAEAINGKTKFSGNGRERPAAYEAGAAYAGGHGAVTGGDRQSLVYGVLRRRRGYCHGLRAQGAQGD